MRVTTMMMSNSLGVQLNQLRSKSASLTDQLASGDRITRASEDLLAGSSVMRVQSRLQQLSQWGSNLVDAQQWIRSTESALGQITELLNRIKEDALIGANGPLDANVSATVSQDAQALLEDLLAALNGKQGEAAMFGGFQTGLDPFTLDWSTGLVTYNGDSGEMRRDLGPGVTLTANLAGDRFGDWSAPDNLLTTVWQVVQGLQAGDAKGIQSTLGSLDKAISQVISLRAEMGTRDRRVEQLESAMTDTYLQLNSVLEQAQGVDAAKAIMELTNTESTYRTALQVGARIFPPTLADFLR